MKIAFGMIVLNGNYVLQEVLESIYPYANQIVVAEGPVTYWQQKGYQTSTDGTNEVLDNFPDPDNKLIVIHSQYPEKDEQSNAYIKKLRDDNEYIWHIDSDEVYKQEDIEKVIALLEKEKYTSMSFKSCCFYGGFERIMGGFEEEFEFHRLKKFYPGSYWATHRPPTIKHVISNPWQEKHLNQEILWEKHGIKMYHYSYTFPEQVFQKMKYYKESLNTSNCHENYFNNIYLPWVLGDDKKKQQIEEKYNGVHEWIKRSHTRTRLFDGSHPEIITKNMDKLRNKFNEQLNKFKHGSI